MRSTRLFWEIEKRIAAAITHTYETMLFNVDIKQEREKRRKRVGNNDEEEW